MYNVIITVVGKTALHLKVHFKRNRGKRESWRRSPARCERVQALAGGKRANMLGESDSVQRISLAVQHSDFLSSQRPPALRQSSVANLKVGITNSFHGVVGSVFVSSRITGIAPHFHQHKLCLVLNQKQPLTFTLPQKA
jgi:hypothetical protein